MNLPKQLIIFDGVCNFCNSTVNFILRHDESGVFKFLPFQSDRAKEILLSLNLSPDYLGSIIYIENGIAYFKSTAALKILKQVGGIYKLLYVFIVVPPFIRHFVYDLIANNRYKLFGKKETCMVPTAEQRSRFL